MEINFNDKDALQAAFNELTAAARMSLDEAKSQKELNIKLANQVKDLTQANINFNEALSNIHTMLNSKRDLWKKDSEMQEFMNKYAAWIASSGSIKLNVMKGQQ